MGEDARMRAPGWVCMAFLVLVVTTSSAQTVTIGAQVRALGGASAIQQRSQMLDGEQHDFDSTSSPAWLAGAEVAVDLTFWNQRHVFSAGFDYLYFRNRFVTSHGARGDATARAVSHYVRAAFPLGGGWRPYVGLGLGIRGSTSHYADGDGYRIRCGTCVEDSNPIQIFAGAEWGPERGYWALTAEARRLSGMDGINRYGSAAHYDSGYNANARLLLGGVRVYFGRLPLGTGDPQPEVSNGTP